MEMTELKIRTTTGGDEGKFSGLCHNVGGGQGNPGIGNHGMQGGGGTGQGNRERGKRGGEVRLEQVRSGTRNEGRREGKE